MKKILSIIIIGLLFAVNIYATPRFKEDGTCYKCDGKGEYKNYRYNRKKMGSKKFFKCEDCNGTGKKPRKVDGKLLVTKKHRRYKNYTIQSVNEKGITIIYKNVFKEKTITINPKYWPAKLYDQVAKRAYMDSKGKMYDMSLCTKRKDRLYQKGDYFFKVGTPVKNKKETYIRASFNCYTITNANNIRYNIYQELPMVVLGETMRRNYIVELLLPPTQEQLKAYFSGKPIKKKSDPQIALINTK